MSESSQLRREIEAAVGELKTVDFALPESGTELHIAMPSDFDVLLDAAAGDPEQNLPYWAEIWPSGIALADAILDDPELVRGKRVIEIGSGLGVTASRRPAMQAPISPWPTTRPSRCSFVATTPFRTPVANRSRSGSTGATLPTSFVSWLHWLSSGSGG